MYYPEPHRFQEQEVQLGLTLAYTLAIAIQNARLYQSEHSQRQLAEALSQAAFSLNRSLNLDEVLDQILEQTRRVAACNSVNIMLVEGKAAYVARRRGYESHPEHVRTMDALVFPLNSPTLQHMLTNGQPVLVQDTARDPLWSALEGAEWVKSYASAPLQIGEQVLGFLNVDSDLAGFFSEETTRRLQAFAAHAAIAIQNARLYQQLQQYNIELRERVLERTAELQAAKERIEGILASVPDAVFVLDDLNQLIQANQAGEVLLSQAIEQDLDLFAAEFLAQLAGGLLPSEKAVVEVKGRAYQALASRLPIDPLKSGLVIVFRDVTRFRELDQMKTQFVSDVSHELRTPLTNLTLYLDLLSAVEDAAKRQSYLDTLRRETGRLTHLIEDLLTISRLEAGRLRVNTRPMNVNVLVTDLAQDRAYMASGKELTLLHETMSDIPMALADSLLLNQCISNLLTNAINYTPPGGTIRLQTSLGQSDGSSWVIIHVADTGVGILPEEREHIFERFYRGSASRNTGASGTGLGLAISKEILDRMNAKITVESEPGKGSTFTIWLPAVL
jgi:signal transduction histidine kinase